MLRRTWIDLLIVLLALGIVADAKAAEQATEVSAATAEEHLVKKVEPTYPPLAKMARIQGKVVLQVRIAKDGSVAETKVKSGHPLLVAAALEAVKQWRYKPFTSDSNAVEATATVEVPFSLGIPENQHKEEQKINNEYFKQEDQCRSLIHSRQYEQAEATCKSAVDLAERLPPERALERTEAYGNTGNALLGQQKFAEALGYFRREATLDEKVLKPIDAELGYGYHHLALALYATGDLKQALDYYDRSIKTLELALGQKSMQEFQGQYLKSLKKILLEYAQVLRQNGDIVAAAAAEQRANSIR